MVQLYKNSHTVCSSSRDYGQLGHMQHAAAEGQEAGPGVAGASSRSRANVAEIAGTEAGPVAGPVARVAFRPHFSK